MKNSRAAAADTGESSRSRADIHNDSALHTKIKLTFVSAGKFFGPGVAGLLKEIDHCGNVRDACTKCGFSYSKGWTIIRNCEENYGYPLVGRQPGGKNGGTAHITEKGRRLLEIYDRLEEEISRQAEKRFHELLNE